MRRQITALLLSMTLAACGQSDRGDGLAGSVAVDAVASEEMAMAMAPMAPSPLPQDMDMIDRPIIQPDPDGSGGGAPPGTAPLMAYAAGSAINKNAPHPHAAALFAENLGNYVAGRPLRNIIDASSGFRVS